MLPMSGLEVPRISFFIASKLPFIPALKIMMDLMSTDADLAVGLTHAGLFRLEIRTNPIGIVEVLRTRPLASLTLFPLVCDLVDISAHGPDPKVLDVLEETFFDKFNVLIPNPMVDIYNPLIPGPFEHVSFVVRKAIADLDARIP